MIDLVFKSAGFHHGRRRQKILTLDGHFEGLRALKRSILDKPDYIWVIPGGRMHSLLPPELKRVHYDLSMQIRYNDGNAARNEVECFKRFLKKRPFSKTRWAKRIIKTTYRFGPIPVLNVGSVDGVPVCVTPLSIPKSIKQKELFPSEVILELISLHFKPCFEDYLSDIFDILRSSFQFSGRRSALHTVRKVNEILGESILPKLKLIDSNIGARDESNIQDEFYVRYEPEMQVIRAAVEIIYKMVNVLRRVSGLEPDLQVDEPPVTDFLSQMPEDSPTREELQECYELLCNPTHKNATACRSGQSTPSRPWISDMRHCSRFLSAVSSYINQYGCERIFIFLSHHMDVYASDSFFDRFRKFVSIKWSNQIHVWTGEGPTDHILLSIMAKIWLSDIQLVYIPNSLSTLHATKKRLQTSADWVVEELYFGIQISQRQKYVVASPQNGPGISMTVLDEFKNQVGTYNWSSIHETITPHEMNPNWGRIASQILDALRQQTYLYHNPRRIGISNDDQKQFQTAVLAPAIRRKLEDLVTGIRFGIYPNHWIVIQELFKIYWKLDEKRKNIGVTANEIVEGLTRGKAPNGQKVSKDWVLSVLRRLIDRRFNIILGEDTVFLLTSSGKRRPHKNHKTFIPELHHLIDKVQSFYKIPIKKDDLLKSFWRIVYEPVGRSNGINNRVN